MTQICINTINLSTEINKWKELESSKVLGSTTSMDLGRYQRSSSYQGTPGWHQLLHSSDGYSTISLDISRPGHELLPVLVVEVISLGRVGAGGVDVASGGWLSSSRIWTSSSFAEETSCTCTNLGKLLGGGATGWELPGNWCHTICLATWLGASPFACWGEPRWSWLKLHCRTSPAGAGGAGWVLLHLSSLASLALLTRTIFYTSFTNQHYSSAQVLS